MVGMLALGVDWSPAYLLAGVVMWSALLTSGVDPVVAGLAIGLTAPAYTPGRQSLEEATRAVPPVPRAADRRSWPAPRRPG